LFSGRSSRRQDSHGGDCQTTQAKRKWGGSVLGQNRLIGVPPEGARYNEVIGQAKPHTLGPKAAGLPYREWSVKRHLLGGSPLLSILHEAVESSNEPKNRLRFSFCDKKKRATVFVARPTRLYTPLLAVSAA
jgi:hypothetical protein